MANRLQLKRGSGAPGSVFYEGEPMYDLQGEVLFIGDTGGTGSGTGSSIASNIAYETVLEMLSRADSSGSGELKLYEDTDNGTDFVTLTTPAALGASYTLTLPPNDGDVGQVVRTDGNGVLTFVNLFNLAADSGTTDVVLADGTVTFAGTAKEIETVVTDNQIQIGLPDDVVVSGNFSSSGITTLASSGGITTTGGDFFVGGIISLIDLEARNVNISGLSTFTGAIDANGGATIDNIQIGITDDNEIDTSTGNLTIDSAGGTTTIDDQLSVTGIATFSGQTDLDGDVNIGDAITDSVTVTGRFDSDLVPLSDSSVDLGLTGVRWAEIWADALTVDNVQIGVSGAGEIDTDAGNLTLDSAGGQVIVDDDLSVTGVSTFTGAIDANGGATIDNIQIGITDDNEIDTTTGNLTIDSAGGTTTIDDQLSVTGISTFSSNVTVTGQTDLNGDVNIGDAITDSITVTGRFDSDLVPLSDSSVDLGTTGLRWAEIYGDALTIDNVQIGVNGTGEIDTDSGNLTLDSATGETIVDDNLTVNGNLRVVGTAVTFEVETTRVEDRLIELGLINDAAPSSATTWDSGIAFNWHDGTIAKKSAIIWYNNTYVAAASSITEANPGGGSDVQDPQITIDVFAPIVADSLYLGGTAAGDEVINSDNEAVNLIFDGGSY